MKTTIAGVVAGAALLAAVTGCEQASTADRGMEQGSGRLYSDAQTLCAADDVGSALYSVQRAADKTSDNLYAATNAPVAK